MVHQNKVIDLGVDGFKFIPNCGVHEDLRGEFIKAMDSSLFEMHEWKEMNSSVSSYSVIRGLHLQLKDPQAKLLRVVKGNIFDVCLDVRPGSPTFKKWASFNLYANEGWLYLPAGVAHGFQAMTHDATVIYMCDQAYSPETSVSINPFDPEVGIPWPIQAGDFSLSDKDRNAQSLMDFLRTRV